MNPGDRTSLPLLHKYVLDPRDDMDLKMTKLRYRLCVAEVANNLGRQSCFEPIMAETMCEVNSAPPPDYNMDSHCLSSPEEEYKDGHMTMKSDDSGILMDDTHEFSMNDTSDQTTTESDNSSDTTPEADNRDTTPCDEDEETETETVHTEEEYYQETETEDMEPIEESVITKTTVTRVVKTVHTTENSDGTPETSEQITESTTITHATPESTITEESRVEEPFETQTTFVTEESDTRWRAPSPEGVEEEIIQPQRKENQQQPPSSPIPEIEIETPSSSSVHSDDRQIEDVHAEEIVEQDEPQEEEEPEEEIERVEFIPGMKCDDVWTALDILKTRYRLSPAVGAVNTRGSKSLPRHVRPVSEFQARELPDPTNNSMRKSVITWSAWDVTHISYPLPDRSSWYVKQEEDAKEQEEVGNVRNSISVKEDEIAKLLEQVLEEDRKKKEQEDKLKEQAQESNTAKPVDLEPVIEEPILEAQAPEPVEAAPPPSTSAEEEPTKKKKRGNVWQRMMRALRKRFNRGSSSTASS